MPILWWVMELYGHKSGTWPTYTLSSRIKLNQEKEKVNEEEYDLKDSQSSSECCTPHQTSKTQDKHPVCSPCTGGIFKKKKKQEEYRKERLEVSRKQHEEKINLMEHLIECFQLK